MDLSRNSTGDSGAASLSQALAVNSSLTNLDLRDNRIGDFGATALSYMNTVNTTVLVDYLSPLEYEENEEEEEGDKEKHINW